MNHKIPFEYHLKKMIKASSPQQYMEHFEHFLNQQFIQTSFDVQEWYRKFYANLDGWLDYNVR